MKFFINSQEVEQKQFQETFLTCRIIEKEEEDLSLVFIRAFIENNTSPAVKEQIIEAVGAYEVNRAFKKINHQVVANIHFMIISDPTPEAKLEKEDE